MKVRIHGKTARYSDTDGSVVFENNGIYLSVSNMGTFPELILFRKGNVKLDITDEVFPEAGQVIDYGDGEQDYVVNPVPATAENMIKALAFISA